MLYININDEYIYLNWYALHFTLCLQTILFTTDEDILDKCAMNDIAFQQDNPMEIEEEILDKRPLTPCTSVSCLLKHLRRP